MPSTSCPSSPPEPLSADRLLDADGLPRWGRFADSLRQADGRDDRLRDAFGRLRSPLARRLGYKQFQYFGGMSDTVIFGCALIDLGYACTVFWYVADAETGERDEQVVRLPGRLGMQLSDNPVAGESRHASRNLRVRMTYEASPRAKSLSLQAGDQVLIEARMAETGFEPMSLCTRAGYQGWVYANKTAGLALEGTLTWRGRQHDLATLRAMGHHDFSCGFMRRETWWNWACVSVDTQDDQGTPVAVGFNLSAGVNETIWSENCLWLDGRLQPVAGVRFDFDPTEPLNPWRIHSLDGQIELSFTPRGMHREQLRLLILAGHFRQLFGKFSGIINTPSRRITLRDCSGFVEDQFVRW